MIILQSNWDSPSFSGSLLITIKLKDKYKFYVTSTMDCLLFIERPEVHFRTLNFRNFN